MSDDTETGQAFSEIPRDPDLTMSRIDKARPDHAASAEYPGQVIDRYTLVTCPR